MCPLFGTCPNALLRILGIMPDILHLQIHHYSDLWCQLPTLTGCRNSRNTVGHLDFSHSSCPIKPPMMSYIHSLWISRCLKDIHP